MKEVGLVVDLAEERTFWLKRGFGENTCLINLG
jgi:hypothetical protein